MQMVDIDEKHVIVSAIQSLQLILPQIVMWRAA
jgi:hypothetical protein